MYTEVNGDSVTGYYNRSLAAITRNAELTFAEREVH